jgi:ribosomal-protein-serine acetyltransferase
VIRIDDEIALVPFSAAFAEAVAEHAERDLERMGRWFAWIHESRSADDVRAYAATVEERRALDLGENYAIVVGGAFAGSVDIHSVSRLHGLGALGYWLGSTYGGRGIMTRAVRTVTDLAFTRHRIHRLEVYAAVDNEPSRAVAERAGFALEAVLRDRLWAPHGFDDAALYVRLAP